MIDVKSGEERQKGTKEKEKGAPFYRRRKLFDEDTLRSEFFFFFTNRPDGALLEREKEGKRSLQLALGEEKKKEKRTPMGHTLSLFRRERELQELKKESKTMASLRKTLKEVLF